MSAISPAENLRPSDLNIVDGRYNERQLAVAELALASMVESPETTEAEEVYNKHYYPKDLATHCEVFVSSKLTLDHIKAVTPPDAMARMRRLAEPMLGANILRINATDAGGGVAIINKAWTPTMRLLGIDAHWHALYPDDEAAKVTKWKIHNVLQDVAPIGTVLNEKDEQTLESWTGLNAELLEKPIRKADVIIIDDWQPSGLIPYIKGYRQRTSRGVIEHKGLNPSATLLFRDHIHTEGQLMVTPGTTQNTTWKYLWDHNRIKEADAFIAHPKKEFVPPNVPDKMAVFMPATCDLLDDLNRPIDDLTRQKGLRFINEQLALNENQTPLDPSRPYIVLIARFDESKGMPQGIESYAKARQKMIDLGVTNANIPQFVVLGNGSVDDPSGDYELEKVMRLRSERYSAIADDLKVVRVPHNDLAINALLKGAKIALQPSIKEGFESRVTDAILQGVPVIGSDRGGIPLQIVNGESGFILAPMDTEAWAERITELMTNTDQYNSMREMTLKHAGTTNYEFTTVPNIIRWLWLSLNAKSPNFYGGLRSVDDHIRTSEA